MKRNINLILLATMVSLSLVSCYEEPDLINDIAVIKGKVPQVAVVWLGTTRTTAASTAIISGLTIAASTPTSFNIEYTSEVSVKEFKVYWAATAAGAQTLISTTPLSTPKYDPILRTYTVAIPITSQDTKGSTRVFFAEIVGTDGLVSAQKSAILTTAK